MREGLRDKYEQRLELLRETARRLEGEADGALEGFPHLDRVVFRVKSTESFLNKALHPKNDPPYAVSLREIEDQVAGRVIVYFRNSISEVRARLLTVFHLTELTERRPKLDAEFGYESEHLICLIPPQAKPDGWNLIDDMPATFEIQLRTVFMHAYAQPQHGLAYKSKEDLSADIKRRLGWIAATAWGSDRFYQDLIDEIAKNAQATPNSELKADP